MTQKRMTLTHTGDAEEKKTEDALFTSDFADAFYWSQRGKPEKMQAWLSKVDAVKQKKPKV